VKNSPEFKGAAFALTQKGQISPPVKTDKGTYILKLISREEINEDDFSVVKDSLTNQLLIEKQNQVFSQWYTQLKENSKLEDFRDRQYQQTAY
jgi:parvulin-like peptidyl-prolyl isomerase